MTSAFAETDLRTLTAWILHDAHRADESSPAALARRAGLAPPRAFTDAALLLEALDAAGPDVMLVDMRLPSPSGLRILPDVAAVAPDVPIIVQAPMKEESLIVEAFKMGACGFLSHGATPEEARMTVRQVARGGVVMPRAAATRLLGAFRENVAASSQRYDLTKREREVLQHMTEGCSRRQVAERLYRSRHTIDSHVQQIYDKLCVNSGVEAVAKALRERLV